MKAPRRKNIRAAEREKLILEAAIRFFAEHGFEGQTRELAKRIGITHSALYRHFTSKEALIERVYEHVYLSRWDPAWTDLLADRSLSVEARLKAFYAQYVEKIFVYEWVRIFVFSGLRSFDITKRYLSLIRTEVIQRICQEIRFERGLPPSTEVPISERECELVWGLHGKVFYLAIRMFVYGTPVPGDLSETVRDAVETFMKGAPQVLADIVSQADAAAREPRSARTPSIVPRLFDGAT